MCVGTRGATWATAQFPKAPKSIGIGELVGSKTSSVHQLGGIKCATMTLTKVWRYSSKLEGAGRQCPLRQVPTPLVGRCKSLVQTHPKGRTAARFECQVAFPGWATRCTMADDTWHRWHKKYSCKSSKKNLAQKNHVSSWHQAPSKHFKHFKHFKHLP